MEFEYWKKNSNRAGPTCQWPISFLPPRPGNRTCAASHGACHQALIALIALSAKKPATVGRRPPPHVAQPYPTRWCRQSRPRSISPPHAHHSLCSALASALWPLSLLAIVDHLCAPSMPSKPRGKTRRCRLFLRHWVGARATGHQCGASKFTTPPPSSTSTTIIDHFLLFPGQADELVSTAWLPRHSPTAPSPPVTRVYPLRHHSPSSVLHHHRPPSPVRFPSIRPLVCVSLGSGMAVGNTFPG
jgi:hypothetical protein